MSRTDQKPADNTKQRSSGLIQKIGLPAILCIAVCGIVVIAHWPALSAKALSFDDSMYLTDNVLVQNPGWMSTKSFLSEVTKPSTVSGYYQPLAMISLMLDYAIGGSEKNLMPFHRTSLALHVANTAMIIVLLYLLFGQTRGERSRTIWVAAAVGLLFGVHPMTVEPIPWVGERKTLLAAFFSLWSLIFYVYSRTTHHARRTTIPLYIGSIAMYLLALMTKPTSVMLPAAMLLLDWWPLKRLKLADSVERIADRKEKSETPYTLYAIRYTLLEKLPFFALGGTFAVITYVSQTGAADTMLPTGAGARRILLILCHNIIFYLQKMVWPVNLSSHYPFPEPLALSKPMVLAGVVGTCILIPALVISMRWTRAALIGWLIFFITILPTMQIVRFSDVIASDKYAYLPSLGLLMTLASFLSWLCKIIGRTGKSLIGQVVIIAAVLILTFAESAATRRYLSFWQDSLTLSQRMLKLAPNSAGVYAHYGSIINMRGRQLEAIECFRKAISLDPLCVIAYYNLGVAYEKQNKLQEAVDCYRNALKVTDFASAYYNLGNILKSQGRLDDAIEHYRQAVKAKPTYVDAHNNLGNILRSQGKFDEAISHFHEALRFKPKSAEIHYNLAITLQRQGKLEDAAKHYSEALRLKPGWPPALSGLASILASHQNPTSHDANKAIEPYK